MDPVKRLTLAAFASVVLMVGAGVVAISCAAARDALPRDRAERARLAVEGLTLATGAARDACSAAVGVNLSPEVETACEVLLSDDDSPVSGDSGPVPGDAPDGGPGNGVRSVP